MVDADIYAALKLSPTARSTRRTYDSYAQPFVGWGLFLHADDIADPYRRGIFISARATNRAERAWLTDMLSAGDPTTEGNQP